ncbi:MAG: hypothetical protein HY005_01595 [Candidatus Staskawiczbacteria bacterium]|nr:hypothetical protein [Candidatus Staskawiczbacteria bacterium]
MEEVKLVEQLSNKERHDLKRQQKLQAQERIIKKNRIKKIVLWSAGSILIFTIIGGLIWYVATRPPTLESDIISRTGLHWHPELAIYVKGEKQEIPENIGIGAVHQPIHTHDDSDQGIIHMEFQGLVRKQDAMIGHFFRNWGKDMRSFGANMKMTVNGEENTEYENYIMLDKDKIELHYE